jgi:hypothetical protein
MPVATVRVGGASLKERAPAPLFDQTSKRFSQQTHLRIASEMGFFFYETTIRHFR